MVVHNATAMTIDFLSTNLGGQITDSVTLTKTKPCFFGVNCNTVGGNRVVEAGARANIGGHGNAKGKANGTVQGGGRAGNGKVDSEAAGEALLQTWRERNAADGHVPADQVAALAELYHATDGESWSHADNWLSSSDPCDPHNAWYGVSCTRVTERTLPNLWNSSSDRGITALHLSGNNLVGSIPNSLGVALGPSLQYLDLASNMLRGELPTTLLGGMPRLHTLYIEPKLDSNATWALTGTLPSAMGTAAGLPNLRYLGMYVCMCARTCMCARSKSASKLRCPTGI